jgi:Mg-chelatase subunit ChlD
MRRVLTIALFAAALAVGGYAAYRIARAPRTETEPGAATAPTPQAAPGPAPGGPSTPATSGPAAAPGSAPAAGSAQTAAATTPAGTPAPPAGPPVRWLDIAAAAVGGHVEQVTSTRADRGWDAGNLIDGGMSDIVCTPLCAWGSKDATFPQDIVLSFYQRREAVLARVVIDTLTIETRGIGQNLPKNVEIAVSTSSATDGFTPVATAELPEVAGEHAVDFPPAHARYLRVRVLSNYGGPRVDVDEVSVFEPDGPDASILADFPRNLALPALGGDLVFFTSEYPTHEAYQLMDGDPARDWRSADAYLPQEFVFAVRDDRAALIDRLVLSSAAAAPTMPKLVSVSTSLTSPTDGYDEVGRFTLKEQAGDQAIPVGRRARFVKLRILENYGSTLLTSLGEVRLMEGNAAGYQSVLFAKGDTAASGAAPPAASAVDAPGAADERETNDSVAQANPLALGGSVRGRIDPVGEHDYFKVSVPGPDRSMLTIDLAGRPNIRTSLDLVTTAGASVKHFDPSRARGNEAVFSWLVDPGDYAFHLTQPPASVVVVWDTSGSMAHRMPDLERAVEAYLGQVPPDERVNLIRFSDDVQVLLPDFTNDRTRLRQAAQGKFVADGSTHFYDAMAKALGLLDGVGGNRAIIVLTDGEDAGSSLHETDFWRLLQQKDVRLYTIGIGEANRYSLRLASSPRRLLTHAALATTGRSFFADASSQLSAFYQQIAGELGAAGTYRLGVTRAAATGTLQVRATGERIASVAAPAQIELILDASGSMKRAIGGHRMIDTAKSVLTDIVNTLPDDMHVALRVYGHRIREGQPGACQDSQLVAPFAKLDRPRLLAGIRSIQALGTTPIAYSLEQVASDMSATGSSGEKMVVLVTDGQEECGGNPSAAVNKLLAAGLKMRLNIVGFALADAALKADLGRLAALANGQFVEAKDAGSLRAAIEQSLAVPYTVLEASGAKVGGGVTGRGLTTLPEGVYTVRVDADQPITIDDVHITARQVTTIELKKEGREVGVQVVPKGG